MLRRQFERAVSRRFAWLKKQVQEFVVEQDAFGLTETTLTHVTTNARFSFMSEGEKVTAFQAWFKEQVETGVLEVPAGTSAAEPWTAEFTTSAYKRGVVRSYVESKPGLGVEAAFAEGSKAQFLEMAFGGPVGVKQIEILGVRSFEALKGITQAMSTEISRELTMGMAHGYGPEKIARSMVKTIEGMTKKRALVLARTEIIHAYAEGQLDSLELQGFEKVEAYVEWNTAGDDRVCPQCEPLNGVVMKIKEARGILPRHPNCRCAWIPVVEKPNKNRRRTLRRSINKSVLAERKKKRPLKEARKVSTWPGADVAP
jgi:SPP1 gp7 family putative phage head morphogenesis protein